MTKKYRIIRNLILVIALAFVFLWRLNIIDGSLWIDEHHLVASVMTSDSLLPLFETNENANLHHGYAIILYILLNYFDFSEILVRMPSLVASMVSFVIFIYVLGLYSPNRLHNLLLSLLFSSLLLNQHFSIEARGYSLSLMFALLAFYLTAKSLRLIHESDNLIQTVFIALAGSVSLGLSVLSHNSAAWVYAASIFAIAAILVSYLIQDREFSTKARRLSWLLGSQFVVVLLIAGKSMLLTMATLRIWSSQDYLFDEISVRFLNRLGNELFSIPNIPYLGLALLSGCGLLLFISLCHLFQKKQLFKRLEDDYFLFLTAFLYIFPVIYLYVTKPFFLFTRFFYVFSPFVFLIPVYVYHRVYASKGIKIFYIALVPIVIYGLIVFPLYPKCPYKDLFCYLDTIRSDPSIPINIFVKERFKDTTKRQAIVYKKYLDAKNIRLHNVTELRGACAHAKKGEYCVVIQQIPYADRCVEINPFARTSGFKETLFYPFRSQRNDGLKIFHSNHWLSANDIVILYSNINRNWRPSPK